MTITYSENVFTSTGNYGIFIKLLLRWKGSIYKLVYRDLMIYVFLYSVLSLTYRFGLPEEGEFFTKKLGQGQNCQKREGKLCFLHKKNHITSSVAL